MKTDNKLIMSELYKIEASVKSIKNITRGNGKETFNLGVIEMEIVKLMKRLESER